MGRPAGLASWRRSAPSGLARGQIFPSSLASPKGTGAEPLKCIDLFGRRMGRLGKDIPAGGKQGFRNDFMAVIIEMVIFIPK
jgi:hypothetical protein